MTITRRTVVALVLGLAACFGLAAQAAGGRFGIGYVFLEANGSELSFPGETIELRVLPFRVHEVLLGADIRLKEDLWLRDVGQVGDAAVSIRLVAVVPSNERARFTLFAGPALRFSMDPSYGTSAGMGAVLGSGAEFFPALPFSVGFDMGLAAVYYSGAQALGFSLFGGLVTRFYFF